MKFASLLILLAAIAPLAAGQTLDTLKYDYMVNLNDNGQQLVAATTFPGELDALFNMRFTPAKPCSLQALLCAFSVVKFQPFSGNDTLVILVYDAQANTKPWFVNVVKTYTVNLGDRGFPAPNIEEANPLSVPIRDVLSIPLNPPVLISPKREMIVAVKLLARQRMKVGDGTWNGFSLLMKYQIPSPDYLRFRRYQIGTDLSTTDNKLATSNGNVGIWLRPIVKYDTTLPPTLLTGVAAAPLPAQAELAQNYPNPFNPSTTLTFSLPAEQEAALTVTDPLGREVRRIAEGRFSAGAHMLQFDGAGLSSGMYLLRLRAGGVVKSRTMLLMK